MPLQTKQSSLKAFYFHEPFTQNFWPDILEEIYKKQVYLQFLPHKKEGSVCLDVGANVGLSTYYFAQHFEKVYSVEPSAQHIESLSAMVKQNELSNVTILPFALSNKDGKTKFYHNDNQTMFSMEALVNKQDDFEEVDTISIDSLFTKLKIEHVDLLKLDVEGSEGLVVTSEGFKKVAPKIKVIAGEWHSWNASSKENFQHALEELGYTFRWRHDTVASVFEAVRV